MNLFNPFKTALFFSLVIFSVLSSCRNKTEDAPLPAPELSVEREISRTEADLNSVLRDVTIYELADTNAVGLDPALPYTYEVVKGIVAGTYTKYVLVRYAGLGTDSLSRSGLVKCFFNGRKTNGTYRDSIVFENARIAGREIKGKITSRQIFIKDGRKFSIEANGSIENDKGLSVHYTSLKIKERTSVSKINEIDDAWAISGSWSGTSSSGENVSLQIPSQLEIKSSCSVRYFNKGVVDFRNLTTGVSRRIKYGNSKCDPRASFVNDKGIEYFFSID